MQIEMFGRGVSRVGSGDGWEFGLGDGGEIGYGYGSNIDKGIKGGVYEVVGGSVGWDFGSGDGAGVDRYIGGESGSDYYVGVEL